jgi:2-C-methyl-D-erythritol 4-phosphate cytidylyltransferase/2-C-methyl-D-erythritol 2,4-cyclodiphosphate synthase
MFKNSKVTAIIAAAGSGRRMGGKINKQYIMLNDMPVLARSVSAFENNPYVDDIIIVVRKGEEELCIKEIVEKYRFFKVSSVIAGGDDRYDSVREAIKILSYETSYVLIHDGARPLVKSETINAVLETCAEHGTAIPAVPLKDTVKCIDGDVITCTPDRSILRAVQTPQGFKRSVIDHAYASPKSDTPVTDDASLVEPLGIPVHIVEGDYGNIKITTPSDVLMAEHLLSPSEHLRYVPRTGSGYDVHAFAEGRKLILGGVDIPHDRGLLGHSDADVLVHAVMDALLGAAALGDIGIHFPDSDPAFSGISSLVLLSHVSALLEENRWKIVNIDATVIAQRPKIAPFVPKMKKNIAEVLKISEYQINIKGTTTERLGFTGREEGIAAQAAAAIIQF